MSSVNGATQDTTGSFFFYSLHIHLRYMCVFITGSCRSLSHVYVSFIKGQEFSYQESQANTAEAWGIKPPHRIANNTAKRHDHTTHEKLVVNPSGNYNQLRLVRQQESSRWRPAENSFSSGLFVLVRSFPPLM